MVQFANGKFRVLVYRCFTAEREPRAPGPLVLDAQGSENKRKFLMQFDIYLVAKAEMKLRVNKLKANMLLYCAPSFQMRENAKSATHMSLRSLRKHVKGLGMLSMNGWC